MITKIASKFVREQLNVKYIDRILSSNDNRVIIEVRNTKLKRTVMK